MIGMGLGLEVGPCAQGGLDEALGFAVGLGGVGLNAQVLEAVPGAGFAEGGGAVAAAVVGHDPLHAHAEGGLIGERAVQGHDGSVALLVGPDVGIGHAGVVVDADMQHSQSAPRQRSRGSAVMR